MRSLLFTVILSLYASMTHAYPASAPDAAEEQVLTPHGLRPKSEVHLIPPGGSIHHTTNAILLLDKNGKTIHSAPIVSQVKRSSLEERALEARFNGWATYAWWYDTTGSPISSFTTTWTVPPAPTTNVGQTLFLFNSIEPADGSAILQPVLQWGPSAGGGGAYWAVAVWYVSSQAYYTNLVTVNPGQELDGSITLVSQSGTAFNYLSFFNNIPGLSGISLTNSPELVWATETLEVYSTSSASNYPQGSTPMYNINLSTVGSSNPGVSWTVVNDASDGLTTTVVTNSGVNGRVDIHYPS